MNNGLWFVFVMEERLRSGGPVLSERDLEVAFGKKFSSLSCYEFARIRPPFPTYDP